MLFSTFNTVKNIKKPIEIGSVTSKRRDRITQEEKYANKENRRQQVFQSPSLNISSPMDSNTDIESQVEDTVISENERKELLSLFTDKNISMDFVLEMKEAFIYFDKVTTLISNIKMRISLFIMRSKCFNL